MKLKAKIARRIGEPLVGQAKKVSVIKRNFPPGRLDSQRKHKTSSSEYKGQMKEKKWLTILLLNLNARFNLL